MCVQACSTLREGSLRTQGRVQELCWVDLISHDVGCAWTRHGSSPHEETFPAPAGAAAREAQANELSVDGQVAWKIAVCKRVLLGLPSVLSGARLEVILFLYVCGVYVPCPYCLYGVVAPNPCDDVEPQAQSRNLLCS